MSSHLTVQSESGSEQLEKEQIIRYATLKVQEENGLKKKPAKLKFLLHIIKTKLEETWPRHLTPDELLPTAQFELSFMRMSLYKQAFLIAELKEGIYRLQDIGWVWITSIMQCSSHLLDKILQLFNKIWNIGNISQSKMALIIPHSKLGKDKSEISTYKPIALTPCLGKLLEIQ